MRQIIPIIFILGVIASNLCAAPITADQIDMTSAISDITILVSAIISLLIVIMSGRKLVSMIGW